MKAKRIFFLDDDVVVPKNALMDQLQFQEESGIPVTCGLYFVREGTPCCFNWKTVSLWRQGERRVLDPLSIPPMAQREPTPIPCEVVSMGCTLIDASVFQKLEPPWFQWTFYADELDHQSEDVYFSLKARRSGFEMRCLPRVECQHLKGGRLDEEGRFVR